VDYVALDLPDTPVVSTNTVAVGFAEVKLNFPVSSTFSDGFYWL
jgi:hypothetical protein